MAGAAPPPVAVAPELSRDDGAETIAAQEAVQMGFPEDQVMRAQAVRHFTSTTVRIGPRPRGFCITS